MHLFLAATGAVVPPAVLEAGLPKLDLRRFPPGSRRLRLPVEGEKDVFLEGVLVPAEEGAPVVLHLLESEGSITWGARGLEGYPGLWRLRDLGLSSVAADYEGVGASGGKRSPRHLERDARALWERALEETEGRPERIVLRAASLGTLAAATLLEGGAEPAGVILIAPVRAETVVKHWARQHVPESLARLATPLIREAVDVDVVETFAALKRPLLVYAPRRDYLLPGEERKLYEEAVRQSGGVWIDTDFGHPACVLHARGMLQEERAFLRRLFPELPPADDRFAEALALLPEAEAEAILGDAQAAERLRRLVSLHRLDPPFLPALLCRHALGAEVYDALVEWIRSLPVETVSNLGLEEGRALLEGLLQEGGARDLGRATELAVWLAELRRGSSEADTDAEEEPWTSGRLLRLARDLGFSTDAEGMRLRQLLFLAAGIPARLRDGSLETFSGGRWLPA